MMVMWLPFWGSDGAKEFLTARYDEDEAVARMHTFDNPQNPRLWNGPGQYPVMTGKSLLADIAAKRAIVRHARHAQEAVEARLAEPPGPVSGHVIAYRDVVRQLAQPYAEHPDFDPAWRV